MMQKHIILSLVCLLFSFGAIAQLEVGFSTSDTAAPGGTVDVDVSVTDFDNIVSAQYFILWDSLVLSYDSVFNVTDQLEQFSIGNIGTPETILNGLDGEMTVSWSHSSTNPFSVPDNTVLFTVRMNVVGNDCDSTAVSIGNIPPFQNIEVIDEDFNDIGAIATPLPFALPGTDCESGGGGGGGNELLTLSGSNLSGDMGDNICMTITVDNFTDVLAAQGGMSWDPTVLSYTGVMNFGFPDFDESAFTTNNTDSGLLSFLWFDDTTVNPVTLPNGSTFFDICFDIIGAPGSSSSIQFIDSPTVEFSNSNSEAIPFTTTNITISVNDDGGGGGGGGGGGSADLNITIEDANGAPGNTVCVPVTVDGFADIQSAQGGITWDASQLSFSETDNVALGSMAFGEIGNNTLSFVWFDDSGVMPATLADGTVLFEICFDVIGSGGTTAISFAENPPLEFSDSSGDVLDFDEDPGVFTISVDGVMPFGLNCVNATIANGTNGCIDITTENFTDIASVQLSMTWDASQLTYTNVTNFDPTISPTGGQFNQTGTNELGLSWASSSGQGITVPNGTTMFSICFDAIVCNGADITGNLNFVSGSQVPIEIGNGAAETVPFDFETCVYTIDCGGECMVNFGTAIISPPQCFGQSTGGITVNPIVTGAGCSLVSCTWFQAVPGGQVIPTTGCNLTGVPAGNYSLVVDTGNGTFQMDYNIPDAQPIVISANIFDETCNSLGGINTTITGGSGQFSCEWPHNGAIGCNIGGLEAGNYMLIVTDTGFGCMQAENFTVPIDNVIEATATPTDADCGGGTISITVDQAGPFDYAWSHDSTVNAPVQNNLDPGTYTITVTDSDLECSDVVMATVEAMSSTLGIESLITNPGTCTGGGSASFDIVGGCLPYSCEVTGGSVALDCDNLIDLAPGTYGIIVTDASGTQVSTSFVIDAFEMITATVSSTDVSGGTLGTITISDITGGTAPYSFEWTTSDGSGVIQGQQNQTMLGPGTYSCTISDVDGCTTLIGPIEIIEVINSGGPPDIVMPFITDVGGCGDECNGAVQATILDGTLPFIYSVTSTDGVVIESNELPIAGLCKGDYVFEVTDALGFQDNVTFTVGGVDEMGATLDSNECDDGSGSGSLQVVPSGGRSPYTYLWSNGDITSNPEFLAAGTHSVTITDSSSEPCSISQIYNIEECVDPGPPPGSCGESSTVLTPNGDGQNDLLFVECATDFPNTFGVYDRFGRQVFETTNYSNDWDGTDLNGDVVTEGVYFWVMDSTFDNGDHRIYKGYVNVIREN